MRQYNEGQPTLIIIDDAAIDPALAGKLENMGCECPPGTCAAEPQFVPTDAGYEAMEEFLAAVFDDIEDEESEDEIYDERLEKIEAIAQLGRTIEALTQIVAKQAELVTLFVEG